MYSPSMNVQYSWKRQYRISPINYGLAARRSEAVIAGPRVTFSTLRVLIEVLLYTWRLHHLCNLASFLVFDLFLAMSMSR